MTATDNDPVISALHNLMQRIQQEYGPLSAEYDAQWRSPCEVGEPFTAPDDGQQRIHWQPTARQYLNDFAGLENALETQVHPSIKAYYGAFWSAHLETRAKDGTVSLLQIWNEEDRERLIENLVGHHLVQKRAKGPLSFFFACTEPDSDLILTVENASGAVLLERPGARPLRQVSDSLADFLQTLAPAPPTDV